MVELTWYALKKYFRFDEAEIRSFIALSVIFAFILSFDKWGLESFDFGTGLVNFVIALVIVASSLLIHDTAHRIFAIKIGYLSKLRTWWMGLLFCLVIAFLTNGKLKLFLGASVWFTHVATRRLSRTEYIESPKSHAYISLMGPIASLLFAGIVRALAAWLPFNPEAVNQLVYFNIMFGVLSFLPIPPLDGSKFFFAARTPYAFLLGTMVSYALLHVIGYPSILISVILGLAAMIFYLYKVEKVIEVK